MPWAGRQAFSNPLAWTARIAHIVSFGVGCPCTPADVTVRASWDSQPTLWCVLVFACVCKCALCLFVCYAPPPPPTVRLPVSRKPDHPWARLGRARGRPRAGGGAAAAGGPAGPEAGVPERPLVGRSSKRIPQSHLNCSGGWGGAWWHFPWASKALWTVPCCCQSRQRVWSRFGKRKGSKRMSGWKGVVREGTLCLFRQKPGIVNRAPKDFLWNFF